MTHVSQQLRSVPFLSTAPREARPRRPLSEEVGFVFVPGTEAPPPISPDQYACNAFDRRPPLEAMASQWLTRSSVVTVYDCGCTMVGSEPVYDAVFRLQSYVWIRSPAPVLMDDPDDP